MPEPDRILKVDAAGRSGMPAAKFAQRIGMKPSTLASWIQRRKERRSEAQAVKLKERVALQWVEASVAEGGATRALLVHLPGGARMEIGDAAQAALAAQLLRTLASGGARC